MKQVMSALGCLGALLLTIIIAAVIAVAMAIGSDNTSDGMENAGFGGGIAEGAPVPAEVRSLILSNIGKYGCAEVTPSLIAAQLFSESGFDRDAQSKDKNGTPIADGIAQFIPGTWATQGVDGNGDGVKDVWNPQDAIPAAIAYDCYLAKQVTNVGGDKTDNMLAAYNAGPYAVQKAGGIPPIPETRDYVKKIRDLAAKWAAIDDGGGVPLPTGSGGAAQAIATAKTALDTMYQYGGDCKPPFDHARNRGCDCSSLMQYAWASAGVNLPRVTTDQVRSGTAVKDVSQLAPGDLVFTPGSDGSASAPGHVGMYIGNSQVIEAPRTGKPVRLTPLSQWTGSAGPMNTIVAMRHIG
ncbi:bifunctional lytic transglycosylase/C40 family peptidase [Streptomyces sp. RKAG337]|uniref:bifunctional lytic transglycosylase/C40 family peptidase n=1 Tax=Streptomyces sp. RKAG337 TaxID=2893404 RepID=UPI00203457F6|nr:NlpC/P60 family protein [Streptomyces sp. RKAG337]MCM2430892.1 NlpC/P60 family protein [Streptomyces sp. RKAG337]